jgi:uncharacterized protein DUF6941
MKLAYALLADAAQNSPDGKISMLGGDFDTIYAQKFPTQHASLALVMRFDVEKQECGLEHQLRVAISGPLNAQVVAPLVSSFVPQANPVYQNRLVKAFITMTIQNLAFESEGVYNFNITVDGRSMGKVTLYLVRLPSGSMPTTH